GDAANGRGRVPGEISTGLRDPTPSGDPLIRETLGRVQGGPQASRPGDRSKMTLEPGMGNRRKRSDGSGQRGWAGERSKLSRVGRARCFPDQRIPGAPEIAQAPRTRQGAPIRSPRTASGQNRTSVQPPNGTRAPYRVPVRRRTVATDAPPRNRATSISYFRILYP